MTLKSYLRGVGWGLLLGPSMALMGAVVAVTFAVGGVAFVLGGLTGQLKVSIDDEPVRP